MDVKVPNDKQLVREALRAQRAGDFEQALRKYAIALEQSPDNPDLLINLAAALRSTGRVEEAIARLREAIELQPRHADAHYNLGNAYRSAERSAEAVKCYRRAISINPEYCQAYSNLALVLKDLERLGDAAACLEIALKHCPDDPKLYLNLGLINGTAGRVEAAIAAYRRAVALDPKDPQAHHNLAVALLDAGDYGGAVAHERLVIDADPGNVEALVTMGQALCSQGDLADALAAFEAALELDPDRLGGRLGKARALLLAGNLPEGFAEYEWRWKRSTTVKPDLAAPEWRGEDIRGKRLLVYAEQGLGDTIQAARFIPALAAQGATVFVRCPPTLGQLMATMEAVTAVIAPEQDPPQHDFQCPIFSLPGVLGTTLETVPDQVPYFDTTGLDGPQIGQSAGGLLNVGISWAGSPDHDNDANRSMKLQDLLPLCSVPGTRFYSLQVGSAVKDIKSAGGRGLVTDLSPRIKTFADTAKIMVALDLIISVDTALAHLAGSLGLATWVMLPFAPDWRWMLGRTDSPWYPTARLYRQPGPGNWAPVVEALINDLRRAVDTPPISPR